MTKNKYKFLILIIVSLLYNLVYFHRVTTNAIADYLIKDIHLNASQLGAMSSTYFIFYAIMQPLIGICTDKYGAKKILLVFVAISLVACVGFAFVYDFYTAVIARSLIGIGVSGVFIPSMKLISEWFEARDFAKANGVFAAVGLLGTLIATAPLAYLSALLGWRNVFFIFAFIGLLLFVIAWLFIHNKDEKLPVGKTQTQQKSYLDKINILIRNKNFWLLTIIFFATYGAYLSFQGLWATQCMTSLTHIPCEQANNYVTFIPIGLIIGAISAGFLSDNVFYSRMVPFRAGLVGTLLCWIIITFASPFLPHIVMYPLFFLLGIFGGISLPLIFVILKDFTPAELFGSALGLVNPAYFLGSFVYQNLTGFILDYFKQNNAYTAYSFRMMMIFCILTFVVTTALSFFMDETFDKTGVLPDKAIS